ncbi:MAG: hypothetical protein BWK76_11935 [Desulfobulbaceae bacterium A2]|nr:MAG: hypothetical protein BWK76_11935 [Desulfobulbaceae bacterium A2]
MVIGCGGKGTEAVYHCRNLVLHELFGGDLHRLAQYPLLRFFVLDSATQEGEGINEPHHLPTIAIASNAIQEAIKNPQHPAAGHGPVQIGSQMPPGKNYAKVLNFLADAVAGNCTCPPIGAMNFLLSWETIKEQLQSQVTTWLSHVTIPADKALPVHANPSRQIYIAAGLYGGTGCGIHLHLAALLRQLLAEMQVSGVNISAVLFLPDLVKTTNATDKKRLRANAYANLKELDYFMAGNPYSLRFAGNHRLEISNQGADVLFNNIYLLNDKNNADLLLTADDVTRMAGEFMFHCCATSLGTYIMQRLVDAPNVARNSGAPLATPTETPLELRPSAYATFGLASAQIPYETFRHNFIVNYAIRVMNDIMLQPADTSPEAQEGIRLRQAALEDRFLKGLQLQEEMELTVDRLLQHFMPSRPGFLPSSQRGLTETIAQYMDRTQTSKLDAAAERIQSQADSVLNPSPVSPEFQQDYLNLLSHKVRSLKNDRLLTAGGGWLCWEVFHNLTKQFETTKKEMETLSHGLDLRPQIRAQIEQLSAAASQHIPRFFPGKSQQRTSTMDRSFRQCKQLCHTYMQTIAAQRAMPVLDQIERLLAAMRDEITLERQNFTRIITCLETKRRPYQTYALCFNPIPENLFDDFILSYQFPPGNTPEDLAQTLRKDGIEINTLTVPLSDFDLYPPQVADQLFALAENRVQRLGQDLWRQTFTQLGLYFPGPGGLTPAAMHGMVNPNAYQITAGKLLKISAPFLEYREERFHAHRENFMIFPQQLVEGTDVAGGLWQKQAWPERKHFRVGGGDVSPYTVTCLQMHFGLPLYCIDEFKEWKDDYEYIHTYDDRPLHKFIFSMPEPYIDVQAQQHVSSADIKECFDWACSVPGNSHSRFGMRHRLKTPVEHLGLA